MWEGGGGKARDRAMLNLIQLYDTKIYVYSKFLKEKNQ